MNARGYGIRQYVAFLALVPLLAMAASMGWFFLQERFSEMNRDLAARGQLLVRQLASSCEYGVFSNNRTFLASVTQSALREADVKSVVVLNAADEKIVASGDTTQPGYGSTRPVNQHIRLFDNGAVLTIYEPIVSTQIALEDAVSATAPQQIGAVIIEMSWQQTNAQKSGLIWVAAGASVAALLITFFLAYLASRIIVNPIRALSGAVDAIAAGQFDTPVSVSGRVKELFSLGNGINRMANELGQQQAFLQQRIDEATAQLRKSEQLFRTLANLAPVGIFRISPGEGYVYANQRWCDMRGLAAVPSMDWNWIDSAHPDDRVRVSSAMDAALRDGGLFKAEYRLLRPDGSSLWVYGAGAAERNEVGEVVGFIATTTDVSELKTLQESLEQQVLERTSQLRELTVKLSVIEERERQLIAQELHDGLCQTLALVKLKLSIFAPCIDECQRQGDFRQGMSAIAELIDQADQTARNLSLRMSPAALQRLGLMPALEWLADEIRRDYAIEVSVSGRDIPADLDMPTVKLIFRNSRELLINAAKHSRAQEVSLLVRLAGPNLAISVTDDGVGFDSQLVFRPSVNGGFGLISIRESIDHIGGDFQIDSSPGDGTVVVMTIPRAVA